MVTGIAALAGVAAVVGVLLAVSGLQARPVRPVGRRRSVNVPSPERVGLILGPAVVVLLLTRWPVAAVGIGALMASATSRRERVNDADRAEDLAAWAEMLRDATGTPRGIEGVLVATADGAPVGVRPHVQRLVQRLPYEPLDRALGSLADDLRHPVGDLVVTALRLASRTGGRHLHSLLDDLVVVARDEARSHRRIEVARARPRSELKTVMIIMGSVVALLSVAARDLLSPYGTLTGQVVLCVVVGIWALGLITMNRLGRAKPVERFLVGEVGA